MSLLNIGIIGCGRAAELIYLPAINKFKDINLAAVVDPIEERRILISEKLKNCLQYSSLDLDLIERIDAAIISTPPDTHIALSSELLKRNKFVLVEKPLALSTTGIEELIEIEASSNASLMMGFNHRYWQPVTDLKERLLKNSRIHSAEIVFTSDYSKWNPVSFVSDPLDDLGSHVFDLIRFIMDKEIISISAKSLDTKNLELNVKVPGNIIHCFLGHSDNTIRFLKIKNEHGNFYITLKSSKILPASGNLRTLLDFKDRVKRKLLKEVSPIKKSYETQLKNFFNFVRFKKQAIPGIQDGISAILAVQAARTSINNKGKEIFINDIQSKIPAER